MNKKGFTLIELLAVIAILGIIGLIAVPNMLGISDNVKKDQMLDDARKLISIAQMKINIDYDARQLSTKRYTFNELNTDKQIKNDPDGGDYVETLSYVEYQNNNGVINYCVYLEGSKRVIKNDSGGCVLESNLHSRSNVKSK